MEKWRAKMSVIYSVKKIIAECERMMNIANTVEESIEAVALTAVLKNEISQFNVIYNNEDVYDKLNIEAGLKTVESLGIMLETLIMERDVVSSTRFKLRKEINRLKVSLEDKKMVLGKNSLLQIVEYWIEYGYMQDMSRQSGHLLFNLDQNEQRRIQNIEREVKEW
jgi:hypothetical protein